MRSALVSGSGGIEAREKVPVEADRAFEQVTGCIVRLAELSGSTRVVLGVAGRVNRRSGRLERARNLPLGDLDDLSAEVLSAATATEVELAGDAELAAVGEAYFGAGTATGTTAYLTLSTGLGAAATAGGRVLAGEVVGFQIGFLRLLGLERPMVDALASGQRIRAMERSTGRIVGDVQGLVAAAADGDADAVTALDEIVEAAAAAAALMCHVCSPDVLVVGGGLGLGAQDVLLPRLARALGDPALSVSASVDVRPARLGDDAGLAGAGAWDRARPILASSPLTETRKA